MTASIVDPLVTSPDAPPRRVIAFCPDYPCPIDLVLIDDDPDALIERLRSHRAEVEHREDHPR